MIGEDPESGRDSALEACLHILRRRKLMVMGVLAITMGLVGYASVFLMKPKYTATARIAFYRENTDVLGLKDVRDILPEDSDYTVSLDTQVRILSSDTLALATIQELRLDKNPSFNPMAAGETATSQSAILDLEPARREALLRTFHDQLSISKAKNTRVIEISYKSKDPRLAAEIANTLARVYREHNFKTRFESTMQTSKWLTQQLSELHGKVEASQQQLISYQSQHGILGLDDKQNIVTSRLDDLNRELTVAEADRIQKEVGYRLALSASPDLVAKDDSDGLLNKLRTQEGTLKTQLAQLRIQYGPANPKVLEVSNEVKETEDQIAGEIKHISHRLNNQYSLALDREKMLRTALAKQKDEATKFNQSTIEYTLLKRDVDANRQLYDGLLQRLREAEVSAGLRSSNIQIVDVAQVPAVPSEPNVPRNIALGVFLGLGGGVVLALLRERMDRTLRSMQQIRTLSPLPMLGVIPVGTANSLKSSKSQKQLGAAPTVALRSLPSPFQMIVDLQPTSLVAEAYRTVLNSVLMSGNTPPRTIMLTSSVTQEGKTSTSINLSIALARQGKRVLLVDTDLRRPSVARAMGLSLKEGWTSFLYAHRNTPDWVDMAKAELDLLIVPVPGIPNLSLLPAGPADPAQAEMLSPEIMRKLIAEWRLKYDHIIIDTPPVLLASDAVRLSVAADSVILVVRSGYTTEEAFRRSQDLLQHVGANVTGCVLNAADLSSPELSYYSAYY